MNKICPYLTILEVEVAFIISTHAEAESLRNMPKGIDAEIGPSEVRLGLHQTGAELSLQVYRLTAERYQR